MKLVIENVSKSFVSRTGHNLPVLQDNRHFRCQPCCFMHKNMLQMFEMYGIFGEVRQMFFAVFVCFAHICTTKFSYLFPEKGKTKKYAMI